MVEEQIPIDEAVRRELARRLDPGLVRTGWAVVTIRNPEGFHLVYRLRRRKPYADSRGIVRPGRGYWIDARSGFEWTPVGGVTPEGILQQTRYSTPERSLQYGATLVLVGLRTGSLGVEAHGRVYTISVEDRCGRCGSELEDPESIERGYGPDCWGIVSGKRAKRGRSAKTTA